MAATNMPEQFAALRREFPPAAVNAMFDECRALFEDLDQDHSGQLDVHEFAVILGTLGFDAPQHAVKASRHAAEAANESDFAQLLFRTIDVSNEGLISRFEFFRWMLIFQCGTPQQKIEFSFSLIDQTRDGSISREEIERVVAATLQLLHSLDLLCPDVGEVTGRLMAAMDKNEDNQISLEEFTEAMLSEDLQAIGMAVGLHSGKEAFHDTGKSIFFGQDKFDFMLAVMVGIQRVMEGCGSAVIDSLAAPSQDERSGMSGSGGAPSTSPSTGRGASLRFARIRTSSLRDTPDADTAVYEMPSTGRSGKPAVIRAFHATSFQRIRDTLGITNDSVSDSLGIKRVIGSILMGELASLSGSVSEGKSGSFFFRSADSQLFVKTISAKECQSLRDMTPAYLAHLEVNPGTLLCRMLGHYEMTLASRSGKNVSYTFIIMTNIVPHPATEIHQRFDLKGSTYKRTVGEGNRDKPGLVLKDLDFRAVRGNIGVGPFRDFVRRQITEDVAFLREQRVVDYSLLICVHHTNRDVAGEHFEWCSVQLQQLREQFQALEQQGLVGGEDGGLWAMDFTMFCKMANPRRRGAHFGTVTGPVEELPSDGLPSYRLAPPFNDRVGEELYWIGIIDFLVPFNTQKLAEHGLKTAMAQSNHSVVPPDQYAQRFVEFNCSCVAHFHENGEATEEAHNHTSNFFRRHISFFGVQAGTLFHWHGHDPEAADGAAPASGGWNGAIGGLGAAPSRTEGVPGVPPPPTKPVHDCLCM